MQILSDIADSFYEKIVKSPHFSVFFLDSKVEDIKRKVVDYLYDQLSCEDDEINFTLSYRLGIMHARKGIPLNNVIYFLDYFQSQIFEHCEKRGESCSPLKMKNLDIMRNIFAKGYLHETIKNLDAISIPLFSVFSTTRIATSILGWMIGINDAVLKDTSYEQVVQNNSSCEVISYLNLPFFNMIFENEDNFFEFNRMHFELHNTASSMFYFLDEKNYIQAYFIYSDFIDQCKSFMNYYFERVVLFEQNNENYFYKFAQNKVQSRKPITLFTFNIRNMQMINKVWGHENGDFLVNEAQRIIDKRHGMTSPHSVFIKTSSAEFLVLLLNLDDNEAMAEFEDLHYNLVHSMPRRGEFNSDYKISSAFLPLGNLSSECSDHLKELIKQTVEASKNSDNKPLICDSNMLRQLNERVIKEEMTRHFIRQSFNKDNFKAFYQTIVSAEDEKIDHVEALARVCDEDNCTSASSFIDYLISTDRIVELDKVILDKIRRDLPLIKKITSTVFINISPKSLRSPSYIQKLKEFIEFLDENSAKSVFEITEQSLFDNVALVRTLYAQYGSKFAIDDFGSGYSNFSIVSDLAQEGLIKYLKIDGTLIKDIHVNVYKENIVTGIVNIAKSLSLDTIAEFVTDEPVSKKVRAIGVSHMQGYHYSVPVPADELGK